MADEDYGDGDGYFFDDDDYLYVEDEYAVADELAETQIPSPGYLNDTAERVEEDYDYDIYAYFGELEYGEDDYWDSETAQTKPTQSQEEVGRGVGGKRKRVDVAVQRPKRRKVSERQGAGGDENVLFRSFSAQEPALPPKPREETQFALLPDWKERFSHESARTPQKKAMPADMQQAAEAADEDDTPTKAQSGTAEHGEDDDWEDDDEEEEEEGEDMQDALAGLDPETLKAILKQKLRETGLGNMDEAAFEQAIAKMLSGSSEDAAGDLTDLLLGQATEGGDTAVSGWLEGQGVQLGGEDEEGPVAVAEEVQGVKEEDGGAKTLPSDSAVGMGSGKHRGVKQGTTETATEAVNNAAVGDNNKTSATASGTKSKLTVREERTGLQTAKRKHPAGGESSQDAEQSDAPMRLSKRAKNTVAGKSGS